jgi:putative ABC transport system substrate-binding protein
VRRRKFVAATVGMAWGTSAVHAQQTGRVYRVGWLDFSSSAENLGIFKKAMSAQGWLEGKSFKLEYRGGEGKVEHLAKAAAELVRLPVDIIVTPGAPETLAAKKATVSIPIVMTGVDDPVARGFVATLARPGGNVTGLTNSRWELTGKLLSLLRELSPRASSAAVIWDASDPEQGVNFGHLQAAARTLGVALLSMPVQRHTDVEPAFAAIKKQKTQLLIVQPSNMLIPSWIADLAQKGGLPLASTSPAYVYEGGLISYTDDWNAVFDRVANYVDRLLKGAKPADLPVELPTKFKLIVNAKTARSLGLAIPSSITVRADHIVE